MAASRISGIPWSFTAHRYDVVANNLLDEKLKSARFGRFIAGYMLEMARGMVSPEAASHAIMLHMGVRLPQELVAPPFRTTPVVVCPGRLVPMKGQRHLVDAAALLAARGVTFELWLAGDGPDRTTIATQIREHGLQERVKMLGVVPHASLLELYRSGAVDCLVLPSLDLGGGIHEGLSVAVIEAMAHAIPAVSTATGGQSELLAGAGCEIPQRDPVALADALAGLLTSADARRRLGAAGRRRIEEGFDVESIAAELVRRFAGTEPLGTPVPATAGGAGRSPRP
jgi:glycosyltransferase involved in cell wall biosynthesis